MKITRRNLPAIRAVCICAWVLVVVSAVIIPGCADQKRQAESLVRTAAEHSNANQHGDAIQCLNRAIALNPGLAEAFYLRGTCNTRLNQPRRAAEDLSAATRLKPGWDEAWCALGIAQMNSGEITSGISSLTKALQLNGGMLSALEARAQAYRELQRSADELNDLNELLRIEPTRIESLMSRGRLLSDLDPERATEDLSKVISLQRDNAAAWLQRGLCYDRIGDTDRALADLNLACRLRPDDFRPWLERGRILRKLQRSGDAVSDLSKAAELAPNEFAVRLELGQAYLADSRTDAAESNLLLAEKLSPENGELQLAMAQTDVALGRRDSAVDRLRILLANDTSKRSGVISEARICLAQLLQESDQTEEAMSCVQKVLETEPADPNALRIRAALLASTDRREEAIEDYTRLISANSARNKVVTGESFLERGRLHLFGNNCAAAVADFSKYLDDNPDHVEALTLRAEAYLALDEADKAITDLTLALLKQPDVSELYVRRAAAFDQIKEPTAALADLQKAVRLPPIDSVLTQNVAERLFQDHQYARVAEILDTLAKSEAGPLSAPQRLLRGRARLADGDLDGAYDDACAISAVEADSSDSVPVTDVVLLQSMIAFRRGDDAEALRLIESVSEAVLTPEILLPYGQALARTDQPQQAIRVYSSLLKSDASNPTALLARATVYRNTAAWQEALSDANRVLQILPDDPRALQIKTVCLFQLGQFSDTLETLDHPALVNRDSIESRWMRILCCGSQNLTFRQMEELNAFLGIAPTHESARLLRAELLEELGHFSDAIADLSVVLRENPKSLMATKNRALLHQRCGNSLSAVDDFTRAIELSADDAELYYRRGIARHQAGQSDEARKDLDKALDLNSSLADAWYVIGNIEASRGQNELALAGYAKAVEIQPEHASAWYNRGNLLFNQSKWQQAIDCWTIAISIQPELFRAYHNRAAAYNRLGRDSEAVADYEKTILLSPGFVSAWDNLAWLLATSENKRVRDPKRAIELATKACEYSQYKDWSCLNTLAACCAETQDFTAALKWAKQARVLAPENSRQELDQLVIAYETRLKATKVAVRPDDGKAIRKQ